MAKKNGFDEEITARVRENIFPAARAAVADWRWFPWHTGPTGECDTGKVHSSQALAVDVFGTIQVSEQRDVILNALAERLNLPASQGWQIELEYLDPSNPLNERRLTQVDAVASCEKTLIFFECKFTENDGGSCRQIQKIGKGPKNKLTQCDQNYAMQRNPANGIEARCALTGKGIRYWDYIPQVFKVANDQDLRPCPFRYSWYQWMRNLTSCYAIAEKRHQRPAVVVVYADAPDLPMAQKVKSADWETLKANIHTQRIPFEAISYQELIAIAMETDHHEGAPWPGLSEWVHRKIQKACTNLMLN